MVDYCYILLQAESVSTFWANLPQNLWIFPGINSQWALGIEITSADWFFDLITLNLSLFDSFLQSK